MKAVIDEKIPYLRDALEAMGVEVMTNMVIGKTLTIDELFEMGYEAVFVGSGAGLPNFMGIPGESLKGVYSANEFLTRVNLMKAYQFPKVATPVYCGKKAACRYRRQQTAGSEPADLCAWYPSGG